MRPQHKALRAVAETLFAAFVLLAVSGTASAQVTFTVSSTPVARATGSDYTALAGPVRFTSSAAGSAGTLFTYLTLKYGAAITNNLPPVETAGFIRAAAASVTADETSEDDYIRVIVAAPEGCEYSEINSYYLYPFVNHQSGQITILLPAVAPGHCGGATITVDHVRVTLHGSSIPGSLSVTATITDVDGEGGPVPSGYSIAPPSSVTVISNILTALANPSIQAAAGGTGVVLLNREVIDSTWGFDISENYMDAWRQAAQMPPIVTNDTNLLLTFTGIPPGVTLNLIGGGSVTISNSSLSQTLPAGNLSNTLLTSAQNTAVLSFTGLPFPLSLTLAETIRFRGTVIVDTGLSLAPGTIGVQISMTPNSPVYFCPGESLPEPCTDAAVPRFEVRQHPSSPLAIVSILSSVSLAVAPSSLAFSYVMDRSTPSSQSLSVTSTAPLTITTTVSSGSNWLSAGPVSATTPATISVSVSPSGLSAGTYFGTVAISSSGVNNSPWTVSVTLRVTTPMTVSPGTLSFSSAIGSAAAPVQSISVTSASALSISASVATTSGGNWLSISPSSGSTPAKIDVSVNPAGLGSGVYAGMITIISAFGSNSPITVPVSLTVASGLRVSPLELSFRHTIGSSPPAAQSISVDADSEVSVQVSSTTASGGGWLVVSPASLSTPGSITVSVNPSPGLAAGSYSGTVTITVSQSANSPQTVVAVRLIVESSISVSPETLSFAHIIGASPPDFQSLSVTGASSLNFTVEARTSSGGNWLAATPASGTTPSSINVSVIPGSLAEGSYTGTVIVSAAGASNTPQIVTINLAVTTVTAVNVPATAQPAQQLPVEIAINPPSPNPVSGCVFASFVSDAVAPADDPNVRFTGSGRMVSFIMPANTTTIPLSQAPTLQTGTTAGIITVSGALQTCAPGISGVTLQTIRINRAAPVITSVEMARTGTGLEVRVFGYATSREMQSALFRFAAGDDFDLTAAELTINVASAFQSWYQAPQSAQFGSMFRFVQPFTVQGDVNGIRSVTVTLTNAQGSATSQPAGF